MEKIFALKQTNHLLNEKIKSLRFSIKRDNNYNAELKYLTNNSETSTCIYEIKGGQKSKTFIEDEFQRIVCLGGSIRITLNDFDEQMILSSSNTMLIPPNTKFDIESITDSEVIIVFKPKKKIFD